MIRSRQDFLRYLQREQGISTYPGWFILYLRTSFKPTLRFLFLLRTCEYLRNSKHGLVNRTLYTIVKYLKYKLGLKLGFSIPENVALEGLQLPHYGTIVINGNARLGKYCRVHVDVNIGASGGTPEAPILGDYVYIAPGAKLYGDIKIADRVAIAANAAVGSSFLESDILIGGVPAKKIGAVDIYRLIRQVERT